MPHGEMLRYEHMGYGSTFEKDLFLKFEAGVLVEERIIENKIDSAEDIDF